MYRHACTTNLKAPNEGQGKTGKINTAVVKPDVNDIQALLGKINYLKHPSSRLLVLLKHTSNSLFHRFMVENISTTFLLGFPSESVFCLCFVLIHGDVHIGTVWRFQLIIY